MGLPDEHESNPVSGPLVWLTEQIRRRRLSPVELVEAAAMRCQRLQPKLHVFAHQAFDQALAAARISEEELASGRSPRPLHGLPFGIKDVFLTRDMPTSACSRLLRDTPPPRRDAALVARLRQLGAIPLGKLTTYEFATGGPSFDLPYPPARNPWNPQRTTGGSSSGSAAAVAADLCAFSLGTDTGGSVRTPASFCGAASFRPSSGRLSSDGLLPLAPTFDTPGVMSQRLSDCRLLLRAVAPLLFDGAEAEPAGGRSDLRGLCFGVPEYLGPDVQLDESVTEGLAAVITAIGENGGAVQTASLPPMWDFTAAFRALMLSEAYAIHRENLESRPERYGEALRYRLNPGRLLSAGDVTASRYQARRLRQALEAVFEDVDLILLPAAPGAAPFLSDMRLSSNFTVPQLTAAFTLGGNPVATLPMGLSGDGMPLGIQIAAAPGRDAFLLQAASAVEQLIPFETQRASMQQRVHLLPDAAPPPVSGALHPGSVALKREADNAFQSVRRRLLPSGTLWEAAIRGDVGAFGSLV